MERQAVKPQKEIKIEKWQIQSPDNLPIWQHRNLRNFKFKDIA